MRALVAVCACMVSLPTLAGPHCTDEPKERWIRLDDMKARVSATYRVDVFKTTDGNCYEIYGRNHQGQRVEVYFNPISGAVVKESTRR